MQPKKFMFFFYHFATLIPCSVTFFLEVYIRFSLKVASKHLSKAKIVKS